jgi:hypothetical protein
MIDQRSHRAVLPVPVFANRIAATGLASVRIITIDHAANLLGVLRQAISCISCAQVHRQLHVGIEQPNQMHLGRRNAPQRFPIEVRTPLA